MVEVDKLASYAFIFVGISFLLSGIGIIYIMITVIGPLEATLSTVGTITGGTTPSLTSYIIAGWVFGLLQTITGFFSLIAGIAVLVQK